MIGLKKIDGTRVFVHQRGGANEWCHVRHVLWRGGIRLWWVVLALLLSCGGGKLGLAQTTDLSSGSQGVTTGVPTVSLDELRLRLKPLTASELAVEAEAWQLLLRRKIEEITQWRLVADGITPPPAADEAGLAGLDAAQIAARLAELQDEKTSLVLRVEAVLSEWELKGGDVVTYRKYVSAQSGVGLSVTDTRTLWAMVKSWAGSEQGGQRWGWNIGKFLVIFLGFYLAARTIATFVKHGVSRVRGVSKLLVDFAERFTRKLVIAIGLIVSLAALEVNISPLLAAVGAAGFVVAFALQDTLSNFASGILILAYRPFDVGHVIEAAGVAGIVDSVDLFSTRVRTFDNKMMIVPNNDIWGGTITNATASETRRVDMVFSVGYQDDLKKAQEILETLVKQHPNVLDDPAPTIKLNELGESSINFICRPWARTSDYWTVYWDLTVQVKDAFDREGISIPFPQRDVHVHQVS